MSPRLTLPAALLFLVVGGCGSVNSMLGGSSEEQALATIKWGFAAKAISIEVRADPQLNLFDGEPHTLVLGVAQSADPNPFLALLAERASIAALLESGAGSKSLLSYERFFISPGRSSVIELDRAENARYVGVVAGYYGLDPKGSARLFPIGTEVTSEGLVVKKRSAAPAPLRVTLHLGPERILGAEDFKPKEHKPPRPQGKGEAPREVDISLDDIEQADRARQAVRAFDRN